MPPSNQVQEFIAKLPPSGQRLAEYLLLHGSSTTHQLKQLEISNISDSAKVINRKAEMAKISFRVVCRRKLAKTSYGSKVNVGYWEAII